MLMGEGGADPQCCAVGHGVAIRCDPQYTYSDHPHHRRRQPKDFPVPRCFPGSYPFCSISSHPQGLTRAGQHFPGTGLEWSSVCGYTLLNMLYPYPSLLYG